MNVPTLSGLSISILIETRGTSKMATAGLINRHRHWPGRPGFNPRSSHTKDSKNGT